jgi:hypothetical protein
MKATQGRTEANTKAMQERMERQICSLLSGTDELKQEIRADGEQMLAKMDANQARMKVMQEQMDAYQAKTDADREADRENLQEMMKAIQEDSKSGQANMRSATGAREEKTDAWLANRKDDPANMHWRPV